MGLLGVCIFFIFPGMQNAKVESLKRENSSLKVENTELKTDISKLKVRISELEKPVKKHVDYSSVNINFINYNGKGPLQSGKDYNVEIKKNKDVITSDDKIEWQVDGFELVDCNLCDLQLKVKAINDSAKITLKINGNDVVCRKFAVGR